MSLFYKRDTEAQEDITQVYVAQIQTQVRQNLNSNLFNAQVPPGMNDWI